MYWFVRVIARIGQPQMTQGFGCPLPPPKPSLTSSSTLSLGMLYLNWIVFNRLFDSETEKMAYPRTVSLSDA